jgi:hypothetical protein
MALALVFAMLSVWGSRNAIVRAAAIREEKTQATDCLVAATYADPRTDDTPLSPLSPLCLHPDSRSLDLRLVGCVRYLVRPGLRTAARLGFLGVWLTLTACRSSTTEVESTERFEQPNLSDQLLSLLPPLGFLPGVWTLQRASGSTITRSPGAGPLTA